MGETFIFSNFAVSTLLYELGNSQTTMTLISEDSWRFPENLGGSKVPCVISDDSREPEIVYITTWDPTTGVAGIERGREGTTAKNWLAGTLVRHTLTAETFLAIARVNPQGEWQDDYQYVPGDLVLHNGISYVAVKANIDSEPAGNGTPDWQALYIPPGISAEVLNWQGRWSSITPYVQGSVVNYAGQIWVAMTPTTNVEPEWGIVSWQSMAPWGGPHRYAPVLTASGVNNYNISLAPDLDPPEAYDGMRVRFRVSSPNTDACMLKVGSLPEFPLRIRHGVNAAKDDFAADEIYEATFFASAAEWLVGSVPELQRRLKIGDDLDAIYKPSIAANKKTTWGSGDVDPVYVDPAELDWPYPEATRGSLEDRLERIERALGLYKAPVAPAIEPLWSEPWEPTMPIGTGGTGNLAGLANGIYPAGSILDMLRVWRYSINANFNTYERNAIVSLEKRNQNNGYGVPATGSKDVGLGEFVVGLTQTAASGVTFLHAMELWYYRADGTRAICAGS